MEYYRQWADGARHLNLHYLQCFRLCFSENIRIVERLSIKTVDIVAMAIANVSIDSMELL